MANAFEEFDKIVERFEKDHDRGIHHELAVKLTASTQAMWSCELRYTPLVNAQERGDYSFTTFIVGGESAERALARAMTELAKWARQNFKREMPGRSMHEWATWQGMGRVKWDDEEDLVKDEEYPDL